MAKKPLAFLTVMTLLLQLMMTSSPLEVQAQENNLAPPFVATPYTDENGNAVPGLEAAVTKPGKESWLATTRDMPTSVSVNDVDGLLTMSNEVIKREFKIPAVGSTGFYTKSYKNMYTEQEYLKNDIKPDVYLGLYNKSYSQIYNNQTINFDPEYYFVGGNQTEQTFVFDGYTIYDTCEKPFEWERYSKPYSNPAAEEWPPAGKRVVFKFRAPDTFPQDYQGITIDVIYEMYDGISAMKKRVEITNTANITITVGKLAPEVLNIQDHMKSQIHIETDYRAAHGHTPMNPIPCGCKNEKDTSAFKELSSMTHVCYAIGPAYQLEQNQTFVTYNTYELLLSTYWFELRFKERKGMYARLFPWITDNPITFHCTAALTTEMIDHAAEAGFEMIIQSYAAPDSSSQMLTRSKTQLDKYKNLINYAHSKGIDIGIYQAQYLLGQYKGTSAYGKNDIGSWNTWCMASAAFDDYWDNFKHFIEYTGVDCVEIDGLYPGCACDNGEEHINADKETDPGNASDTTTGDPSKYQVHHGYYDSTVKQWENATRMLTKTMRDLDVYVKVPDWYYLNGGNKNGIGYEEVAWSQPRKEQLLYGRQIIYNSSYARPTSMSWSHIPFVQYHGGGNEAAFMPFHENLEDYNWVIAQNIGNGVTSDYRGSSLFDSVSLKYMKKWVNFYKKYRGIVDSDMVQIAQATYAPDSNRQITTKLDTLYHVNAKNSGEKGLLWVYNQSNEVRNETIKVPMYYTGLTNMTYPNVPIKGSLGKDVKSYNTWPPDYSWLPNEEVNYMQQGIINGVSLGTAEFAKEGIDVQTMSIDSNGNVQLEVSLPPMSFTYYTIYAEGEAPEKTVQVGKVVDVESTGVTGNTISLTWNKEVPLTVTENGVIDNNPSIFVDHFNIYRDGNYVGNTITNNYTDDGLLENTNYTYQVEAVVADVKGAKSDALSVSTVVDTIKPTVVHVTVDTANEIKVMFSEIVDQGTGGNISNYTVSGGINVQSAVVNGHEVTLTVDPLTPIISYTLSIANVADTASSMNVMEPVQKDIFYGYITSYPLDAITNNTISEIVHNKQVKIYNGAVVDSYMGSVVRLEAAQKAYADLGSHLLDDVSNYTISLWLNTEDVTKQVLMSQGQDQVDRNDFTLYLEDAVPKFHVSNTDASKHIQLVSSKAIQSNHWNHVAVTCQEGTYTMYLNGQQVAQATESDMVTAYANTLYLGTITNNAGGDRTLFYNGLMSDVSLYRIGLTSEQVSNLYYHKPISTRLHLLSNGQSSRQVAKGDTIPYTLESENPEVQLGNATINYTISDPSAVTLDTTNQTITLDAIPSNANAVTIVAQTTIDGRSYQSEQLSITVLDDLTLNWKNLTVRDGEWTINGNNEFIAPITDKDEVLIRKNLAVSEGVLEADVRLGSHSNQIQGLVIGWGNDTSDASKQQGYEILLKNNDLKLHKSGTGDLATATYSTDPNTWIHLKCMFKDGEIKVYVNDALKITYTNNVNIVDNAYMGFFSVIWPHVTNVEPPRFRNFQYSQQ